MKVRGAVRLVVAAGLCGLMPAASASAEIVFLASGRTLSIKQHRDEGNAIVMTLRDGGEVTCNKDVIDRIVADEVPHPDPVTVSAQAAAPASSSAASLLEATPYGDIITSVAQAHGVDPLLVSALIEVESGYKPRARSNKGAMGLMQIMPATAREYNVRNPFDPRANIEAGITHLKSLIDRWGVELGLAAYNAGEGAVEKFNGIPPYRETRTYVSRILAIAGVK